MHLARAVHIRNRRLHGIIRATAPPTPQPAAALRYSQYLMGGGSEDGKSPYGGRPPINGRSTPMHGTEHPQAPLAWRSLLRGQRRYEASSRLRLRPAFTYRPTNCSAADGPRRAARRAAQLPGASSKTALGKSRPPQVTGCTSEACAASLAAIRAQQMRSENAKPAAMLRR